ncbi:MAG: PqqD family protein [Pyrinomonadaceae bacterium]|nr:PqqD family protein [Pyrinomonadaceae bacterium]
MRSSKDWISRTNGIVTQKAESELLIYDTQSYKAHRLNEPSARIWEAASGGRDLSAIRRIVSKKLGAQISDDFVRIGLERLMSQGLVEGPELGLKAPERRKMLKRLAVTAAVSLPAVFSLVAPRAVDAQSGLPNGSPCQNSPQCASGNCVGIGGGVKECRP